MRSTVIIGSNYGDEGKGLLTDYVSRALKRHYAGNAPIVVRFNGGAQAGHTVQTDTAKHVFSHIGSGCLAGADTYLSRFFASDPAEFEEEVTELVKIGQPTNKIFVDAMSPLVTPFDYIINQTVEKARGNERHGSCGMGINETVERTTHPEFQLYYQDQDLNVMREKLNRIRDEWVPKRLEQHGLKDMIFRDTENEINKYLEQCRKFFNVTHLVSDFSAKPFGNRELVFEGAQGLLLDQNHENFPHVTRSNTGIKNVAELCLEAGINDLDIVYVSRWYLTRHGRGPLPNEYFNGEMNYIVDETNQPNPWQETIRFAPLDIHSWKKNVEHDLKNLPSTIRANILYAITCLNQAEIIDVLNNGVALSAKAKDFPLLLSECLDTKSIIESWGPTAKDFIWFEGKK